MICASYVRNLSWFGEVVSIAEQNEKIASFMKERRLTVTQIFEDETDDREKEDGFLKMKEAGMNRRFDCIVMWSMVFFGKDPLIGYDLLKHAFVPCGIDFAVVSDNYFSIGRSADEIDEYLTKKYKERRSAHLTNMRGSNRDKRMNTLYGYRRVDGQFIIDEKIEPIVRKIFDLALHKKKPKEIVAYLNDAAIPSSHFYLNKEAGRSTEQISDKWTISPVKKILQDTRYMGVWNRCSKGNKFEEPFPAYITPEQHEKAKSVIGKVGIRQGRRTNPLTKKVYDKGTGIRLYSGDYHMAGGQRRFYFSIHTEETLAYEIRSAAYDDVIGWVTEELKKEKDAAVGVLKKLASEKGAIERERRLLENRPVMQDIFEQMKIEVELNPTFSEQQTSRLPELDRDFSELQKKVEHVKQVFSESNPWIKLYASMDENSPLDLGKSKTYIEKVYLNAFRSAELIPKFADWKAELPKEWLEVENGA